MRSRAVLVTLVSALAAWPAAAGTRGPRIVVRAPAGMAAESREIDRLAAQGFDRAMRLAGLDDAGPPIEVVLAPAGSQIERATVPWISGWANGATGVVVLLPSRVDRYPDRTLGPLLRHEVAHVLVARAAAGRPVPRWFDEGIAMAAGRESDLGDRARVALAVMTDASLPIARLDRAFAGGESEVQAAYALAGDLVRELERRRGEAVTGAILARLAAGERFRDAFHHATGTTLSAFEIDYWSRRTLWDRWIPIVSSSAIFWSAVALLALAAVRRKRRHAAEVRQRWDVEESRASDGDDPGPPGE